MKRAICLLLILITACNLQAQEPLTLNIKDDGYRGLWYSNQPSNDKYVYKYSGGLATYPANHYPISVYAKEVDKTFFCYGGTDKSGNTLLHVVSYYDHKTKQVPKPTVVLDKKTNNAHNNPVMNIDDEGYIWIFSTAHADHMPAYIHKSVKPYDINEFKRIFPTKIVDGEKVPMNNFSYLQTWRQKGKGFLNLFTHYDRKVIPNQPSKPRRSIGYMTSKDGVDYSEWKDIAIIEEGHYQTSGGYLDQKIGTSFNFHPIKEGENGLNYRTNLYYLETKDMGRTWNIADGSTIALPLTESRNKALVKDYQSLGLNVYINDLAYDKKGNPVILYVTSKGFQSGPEQGPRKWTIARYTGSSWEIIPVTTSGSNYDMGSLYIDEKGVWRIVGPTTSGPQAYNTGGEMVLWTSKNEGKTWKSKALTSNSQFNHSYARRPVNVHNGFYAFWADGHGRQKSESRLYFSDKRGNVYRLPEQMTTDFAKPEKLKKAKR
ncbi:BNR-4 repeat-containing protein [Pseudopedobacter sp.]|uniref:BNR-4 repeat-containing protein n=1 Tax=Pseudopedobacter sp. TaxID=1936787 RepID=UPI003340EA57